MTMLTLSQSQLMLLLLMTLNESTQDGRCLEIQTETEAESILRIHRAEKSVVPLSPQSIHSFPFVPSLPLSNIFNCIKHLD